MSVPNAPNLLLLFTGILDNEPLTVESSESWRKILNVNVVAASLCAQISINTMIEKGNF